MAKWIHRALVGFVLALHAALLAWGAYRHSPVIDEWGHLPAGIMYWREGRYDVYRVNPPLVRAVATLPLLIDGPDVVGTAPMAEGLRRSEEIAGLNLYMHYGGRAFRYFVVARWACIPFSLLGGIICYAWAKELYGRNAGLAAVMMWCLSPSILAYAQLITPDVGAAAFGVAAHYTYWRWLREPKWSTSVLLGLVLGLTLLTKSTWILVFGLWPVLWLLYRFGSEPSARRWNQDARQLLTVAVIALYLLNAAYEFHGSFTLLGEYRFMSRALTGRPDDAEDGTPSEGEWHNRFEGTWAGVIPVPLPRDFVLGIDTQKVDFENRMWSYLRGEWRKGGWWYYYLYAMAIKEPLGTWGLVLLATALAVRKGARDLMKREGWLLLPALTVLVLVSSQTGFNHHLRYVLPAFPFLFIFAAGSFRDVPRRSLLTNCLAGGLFVWSIVSSLAVYPHSLSYFNELVGGPEHGHAHLLNSNIEWGQDLIYLREWIEEHPDVTMQGIALTMGMAPSLINVSAPPPPPEPLPGCYAVSVERIRDHEDGFAYFLELKPVAMVGYSVYIYCVSLEDANRLREAMGLPSIVAGERPRSLRNARVRPEAGEPGQASRKRGA